MAATMVLGFSFTYFGPLARGAYPEVSPMVHVHGWSFFAWYLLLPLQTALVRSRKLPLHRKLGLAGAALGALMIAVGLVVSLVRIDQSRAPGADPFWQLMGVPIFAAWALFTVFFVAAMRPRRRAEEHRRLIILASAVALSAATFRIVVRIAGFSTWSAFIGMVAAAAFPLVAIAFERRDRASVHPVYAWGVPAIVLVIGGTFLLAGTPAQDALVQALGRGGALLAPLYLDP